MKNLRSIVIGLGSVAAFLSIVIFPYSRRVQMAGPTWTRDMHVLIVPTLLRAALIVAVTLVLARLLPKKG